MSKSTGKIIAAVIACLAVGLLFIGRAPADNPDLLKEAEARRKIAAESAERDIRDARDEAKQTARTQPNKALDRIRNLLRLVDANPNFSDEKKDALTAQLKKDIVDIQKLADAASNPEIPSGFHPVTKDPRADDHKKLVDAALARYTSSKEALQESEDLRARKSLAMAQLFRQVDESSIPSVEPYVLPRDWKELSLRRLKKNTLTDTEKAILKALNTSITIDLTDQRFGGVIDWFQKQTGQTILLDKPALDDINVNTESTVSAHLNKVSTRTALKKVLADLGLTYVIKDETIFVTTPMKAKDMMTIRTYYIGDLLGAYDLSLGPVLSQYQAMATVAQLVNMVQNNIDKDSWEINGKEGGGTIVFDLAHMTLVVKQSAEIHYKMLQGFNP
jgi:hypothetical protein